MKKWLILMMVFFTTACGYHLRGALDLPSKIKSIYLQGGSAPLRDQFARTLQGSSGHLVKSAKLAEVTIKLFDSDIRQRGVSLSAGGRSNEFELYYRVEYELHDSANKLLLAREPLEIRREYFNDQLDIIAKDNEEGVIRNEMYQQAVRSILNRAIAVLKKDKPK